MVKSAHKRVEKRVQTSAEVNTGRRIAYGNSQEDKAKIEESRGAIKTFFSDWNEGMKKMVTTPGGRPLFYKMTGRPICTNSLFKLFDL